MAHKHPKVVDHRLDRFPPEAEGQFDVVPESDIDELNRLMAEKYGIGQGRLEVIEEPA